MQSKSTYNNRLAGLVPPGRRGKLPRVLANKDEDMLGLRLILVSKQKTLNVNQNFWLMLTLLILIGSEYIEFVHSLNDARDNVNTGYITRSTCNC